MASKELTAALEAARAAAELIRGFYGRNPAVRTKADQSPVTEADLAAEQLIRDILTRRFPGYGFYGEETGQHAMGADNVWLVDPIDGTKSFVRGTPFFSTQIALQRAGELVLGVSSAPVYGELAWAERGAGAWLGERALPERALQVSSVSELAGCVLSAGNLKTLAASAHWRNFGELIGRVNRIRGYGDFLHYHLLAQGSLDAVIESDVCILDIAALTVIVEEAGGVFTDLDGHAVTLATTSVLASAPALHPRLLEALRR